MTSLKNFFFRSLKILYLRFFKQYQLIFNNTYRLEAEKYNSLKKNIKLPLRIHKFKMNVNPDDEGISRDLIVHKLKEPIFTNALLKGGIVKQGDVILDVGANIGYFVLLQRMLIGPKGHIYAVEPVKSNIELLNQNLKLNKCRNVDVVHYAFGAKNGKSYIYLSDKSNWHSMLGSSTNSKKEEVPLITGDTFIKGKRKPTLIRMDVEGYELEILKGMKKTLAKKDIKILMAIHAEFLKNKGVKQLFEILKKNNFIPKLATDEINIFLPKNRFFRLIMKNLNEEFLLKDKLVSPTYEELFNWIVKMHNAPNVYFVKK